MLAFLGKTISVKSGVGRKPLDREKSENTKPTVVRLTAELRARVEAAAGPNRMAVFIREAVEAELARREAEPPTSTRREKAKKP